MPKITCGYCKETIHGSNVMAMGKYWHKEHFMCTHCKKPLKGSKFIQEDGKPYCEADWNALFRYQNLPDNAQNKLPIQDTVETPESVQILYKDNFVCTYCRKQFENKKCFITDEKTYCEADYKAIFEGTKIPFCAYCSKPIKGTMVTALGKPWHKNHFFCAHCKKSLHNSSFVEEDGKPYCEADYKKLFKSKQSDQSSGSKSRQSDEASGRSSKQSDQSSGRKSNQSDEASGRKSKKSNDSSGSKSKECFLNFCKRSKSKEVQRSKSKEIQRSKPKEIQGSDPICASCNKPITDTILSALDKEWHKDHFVCAHCQKPIEESTFKTKDGQPYCDKDYTNIFRRCSGCNNMIQDVIVKALGKNWHRQCFHCTKCNNPITAQQEFVETNGNPFCLACGMT